MTRQERAVCEAAIAWHEAWLVMDLHSPMDKERAKQADIALGEATRALIGERQKPRPKPPKAKP